MSFTERWLRRPQSTWVRKAIFQIHLWSGITLGLYIVVVCVSGSAIVFRNDLYGLFEGWTKAGATGRQIQIMDVGYHFMRWMGELHGRLFLGTDGMLVNAIGGFLTAAVCLTGLVVWWPGIANWRRGLVMRGGVGWKRMTFDLHSAVGFWTFGLLFMWGVTGGYFVFPEPFRAVINYFTPINPPRIVPQNVTGAAPAPASVGQPIGPLTRRPRRPVTLGGKILRDFSYAHYGNFAGWKTKLLWLLLGLAPVVLFGTALLMWWNRVLSPLMRRLRRMRRAPEDVPAGVGLGSE
jgi:uncharacterized iron-regulated membrane protein